MGRTERELRRVLLVLDTATGGQGLVQAGTALAARLRAELGGVFVHDPRLQRLAALPGAAEVLRGSGLARDITPDALARELIAQVRRIADELAEHAGALGLSSEPRLAQVRSEAELATQVEQADLLLVGKRAGGELVAQGELGTMALRLASAAACPVVLLEEQAPMEGPVLALVEDLETGAWVVDMAERLARAVRGALSVALLGYSPGEAQLLRAELERRLAPHPLAGGFQELRSPDLLPVADLLWRQGASLVAVGARSALIQRLGLGGLATGLKASVVIVP